MGSRPPTIAEACAVVSVRCSYNSEATRSRGSRLDACYVDVSLVMAVVA